MKTAILQEAVARDRLALDGVRQFLAGPVIPPRPADMPTVWQSGTARVLHYHDAEKTGSNAAAIFLIPSLINRYYILDLNEKRSLARYLAAQGHDVYLLDWGTLAEEDYAFSTTDYLKQKLIPATRFLFERHGRPLIPVGFCMGGLFTLALAQFYPEWVARFALLATPWNFHAADSSTIRPSPRMAQKALAWLEDRTHLPGEAIPLLFHMCDPWRFQEKFIEFGKIRSAGSRRYFTEIEQWSNDCVSLAKGVAAECMFAWLARNETYHGQWSIAGEVVCPQKITGECFFVAPQHDRIVSPGNALALADILPNKRVLRPSSGHIGMITGARRKVRLWEPLARWLNA